MNIFPSNEYFFSPEIVSPEFQCKISFQELLFIDSSFFFIRFKFVISISILYEFFPEHSSRMYAILTNNRNILHDNTIAYQIMTHFYFNNRTEFQIFQTFCFEFKNRHTCFTLSTCWWLIEIYVFWIDIGWTQRKRKSTIVNCSRNCLISVNISDCCTTHFSLKMQF